MSREHDAMLICRCRRGDRSAFTELVERHRDRAFAVALGVMRHHEDAADVVQESFIAVLRHLDQFSEQSAFTTWLHSIVVRKAIDMRRRRVATPVDPSGHQLRSVVSASDVHAAHMMQHDLLAAVASLDEGFRDAVLLVDVLGYGVDEAAEVLGVAPGTIKSRVFRGRAQVADMLGTQGYSGTSN